MHCPNCGTESQGSDRFCVRCGAEMRAAGTAAPAQDAASDPAPFEPPSLPHQPPVQPAQAPPAYPPQMPPQPLAPEPRKRSGCRTGCLITALVLLLLCGVLAAAVLGLPERLGLVSSDFEQRFPAGSFGVAADVVDEAIAASGQTTMGVDIYVLPVDGADYTIAYIVLDESEGYEWSGAGEDPITGMFIDVATSTAAEETAVERVAVEYRTADGETLFMVTAARADIVAFAEGGLTRDEFLQACDGQGDIARVVQMQLQEVREWE